jgi:hypothetical protein
MLTVRESTVVDFEEYRSGRDCRLLIFAPWYYGNHPTYLRHLNNNWCQYQLIGSLDIVVLPSFLHEHANVV